MNVLYRALNKLAILLLAIFHPLSPKVAKGYRLRRKQKGIYPWLNFPKATKPVWFHCASGEFEYALPLIRRIKQEDREQKILVTYFTPSYAERIAREQMVDFSCPAPWDSPRIMSEFIAHHQPRMLLIARTDVWHEMTRQCQLAGVPTVIFSMTYNKHLNSLARLFSRWRLKHIDHFFVVSETDRQLLGTVVDGEKIQVSGDTRYEQCLHRLNQAAPDLKIQSSNLSKKVFLAGSTWREDEIVLVDAMARNPYQCHWILVPHEVEEDHVNSLREMIRIRGFRVTLFSEIETWNGEGVLIIDRVGILAHLYPLADVSFIGGSYRRQVHSVMESLASGRITLVGPHCRNSREAEEFSKMTEGFSMAPVQICEATQVKAVLRQALETWTQADADKLKDLVRSRSRVSEPLWHELLKLYS